jgi:hypothetical protein
MHSTKHYVVGRSMYFKLLKILNVLVFSLMVVELGETIICGKEIVLFFSLEFQFQPFIMRYRRENK